MKGVISFRDELKESLKDEKFKNAFEEEEIFANLAIQIANERKELGLSQKEIAEYFNTSQQAISRLENKDYEGYTLKTLLKLAHVFKKKLEIKFI